MTDLVRRRLVRGLAAFAPVIAAAGCASAPAGAGPVELAPGVWVTLGVAGAPDEHNLGRIGNAGFVVGPQGVVAIDTGTSRAHGEALLAAIARVTDRPVRLALVTHTRPEFLFGGTAFRARGIPVRMHRRTATLMTARCESCLKTLRHVVGEAPLAGTAMYQADEVFEGTHDLDVGGRRLRVLYFGHSSGPGDIAVLDVQSGTLFAGGLLDAGRVPDIQDSDLAGWKRALAELRALAPRALVPGHGPVSPPSLIDTVERYMARLENTVRSLVAAGVSLLDVPDRAVLSEYESWDQYETIHRRNATVAYLRFERQLLFK